MNLVQKSGVRAVSLAGLTAAVQSANAAAMAVPAEITDAALSVAAIGAAVFAIFVGIKLFKWVRRAL